MMVLSLAFIISYSKKVLTDLSTGIGSREGAFVMVTFWLVEAMGRVSNTL